MLTNFDHDRQGFNTLIPPSHESSAVTVDCISRLSGPLNLILRYTTVDIQISIKITPLSKSLIALFSTLHLVYGTNSPLIFVSLVRHSLLHFHLSHMAYHHHHPYHLHDHHLHLLLLVLSFFLNLRLGSLPNHFLHRPSPFLPD